MAGSVTALLAALFFAGLGFVWVFPDLGEALIRGFRWFAVATGAIA